MYRLSRYQKSIDTSSESVCDGLLELIDKVDGREMEELPSFHGTIDPDALNELFTQRSSGADRGIECTISFRYAEYDVHIDSIQSQCTITLVAGR